MGISRPESTAWLEIPPGAHLIEQVSARRGRSTRRYLPTWLSPSSEAIWFVLSELLEGRMPKSKVMCWNTVVTEGRDHDDRYDDGHNTQKITISPVTRIEAREDHDLSRRRGKVADSLFHVEQFRGFEKFSEGRMFYEMPQITPRTCGICPVSHHLASVKACDVIAGTTPTPTAHKLRDLMHMGQVIQSHGMHFFELAGPDFVLGWDADPKIRHVGGIIAADPDLAVKAVQLRAYGQKIIKALGERRRTPDLRYPRRRDEGRPARRGSRWMLSRLDRHIATTQVGLAFFKDWAMGHAEMVNEFAVFLGLYGPGPGRRSAGAL